MNNLKEFTRLIIDDIWPPCDFAQRVKTTCAVILLVLVELIVYGIVGNIISSVEGGPWWQHPLWAMIFGGINIAALCVAIFYYADDMP